MTPSRLSLAPTCLALAALAATMLAPQIASAQSPGAPGQPAPIAMSTPTEDGAGHGCFAKRARRDTSSRSGLMFGASIGRGSIAIECALCDNVAPLTEALSLQAHVGWMLGSRAAVMVEHWTVRYNDRGSEWFDDSADHLVAQRITTLSGQLWLTRRLWTRAGLGVGKHISDSRYAKGFGDRGFDNALARAAADQMTEAAGAWTPAASWAVGIEWAQTAKFALDVQFRVATTRRPDDAYVVHNTGIVFGATWF